MYNYNFLDDNRNKQAVVSLYSPEEGFMKGNLFSNLYEQYKDYKPAAIKANNEQTSLLLQISEVTFAAHELNLYLDLHPDDDSMLTLFNDYRKSANSLINEYEKKYGPINLASDALTTSPFLWEADAWPFEGGNN